MSMGPGQPRPVTALPPDASLNDNAHAVADAGAARMA